MHQPIMLPRTLQDTRKGGKNAYHIVTGRNGREKKEGINTKAKAKEAMGWQSNLYCSECTSGIIDSEININIKNTVQ
jgi:hypothetical protein